MKLSHYMATAMRGHALDMLDHAEVATQPWCDLLRILATNSNAMAEIFDRIARDGDFELDARQEAELMAIRFGAETGVSGGPRPQT